MSTVKVNKITPRTCNSIQLGESGDTLTIPSGATLQNCGTATGFGISFCTTVKTGDFTATAGKGFFINTGFPVTIMNYFYFCINTLTFYFRPISS